MNLHAFLEDKPLYYTKIDYARMPRVYARIKNNFNSSKIIHLVGTNGKGTTGRFLATALKNLGLHVGHYTSPHIMHFNERIWLNGENIPLSSLEKVHKKLQNILTKEERESLSYFEYTTFLAMLCFNRCEYIVLEAGLGGIHDATAVFPKTLTLVTPISYDHEAFLGSSITSIAKEKLYAIENNAIIARQNHPEVYKVAREIELKKNVNIQDLSSMLFPSDKDTIEEIAKTLALAPYLKDNLQLSIAALNFLELHYDSSSFKDSLLFGRLSKFNENIFIDVGHNPLAARSIVESLTDEKYILIYNSYEDKEYKKILAILKPLIKHVEIIHIFDERIEKVARLQRVLTDLKIKCTAYKKIQKDQKYLVFGSFKVVEAFLKGYNE